MVVDGSDGGERVWDLPATAPTAGRVGAWRNRREALAAVHDELGASTAAPQQSGTHSGCERPEATVRAVLGLREVGVQGSHPRPGASKQR